jgi:hypothetical protein
VISYPFPTTTLGEHITTSHVSEVRFLENLENELTLWLSDNTIDVFEEAPIIDGLRDDIIARLETLGESRHL